MHLMEVKHFFDASHQLTDNPQLITKACARLHGHTYAVIVKAGTSTLNEAQMVIDFRAIKDIVDELDHQHINDIFMEYEFSHQWEPTAERIAQFIAQRVADELGLFVEVSICEGYKGLEKASWITYK